MKRNSRFSLRWKSTIIHNYLMPTRTCSKRTLLNRKGARTTLGPTLYRLSKEQTWVQEQILLPSNMKSTRTTSWSSPRPRSCFTRPLRLTMETQLLLLLRKHTMKASGAIWSTCQRSTWRLKFRPCTDRVCSQRNLRVWRWIVGIWQLIRPY